jgi:hypothetical protein
MWIPIRSVIPGLAFALVGDVGGRLHTRRVDETYWPRFISVAWLMAGLVALLTIGGCRQGVPVLDTGPKPPTAEGTISGTVRGPEGTSAVEGRMVQVVNVETGERQRATTSNTGGFTFKVKPGRYRVELTLLDGETIVSQPGVMNVNRSDVDAHADFVIRTGGRVSRPRNPSYRVDDGLGSPIA